MVVVDAQTPRRSRRFQPLVGRRRGGDSDDDEILDGCETVSWTGAPINVRETRPSDLHDEDRFTAEEESEEDAKAETRFYAGFTKAVMVPTGNKKRKISKDVDFSIGDTVLVQTQAKQPSVGVIVALWEVRMPGEEGEEKVYMKVKVHWFLRPEELASVRAKKTHEKVRRSMDFT